MSRRPRTDPAHDPDHAPSDDALRRRWTAIAALLDERQRRVYAAAEAEALGHGGIARVMAVTGLARGTIAAGVRALRDGTPRDARVRRAGAGRKGAQVRDPALADALHRLLTDPSAAPRSLRDIADELTRRGHRVSHATVARLMTREGWTRPVRTPLPIAGTIRSRRAEPVRATDAARQPPTAAMTIPRGPAAAMPRDDDERRDFIAGLANGLRVIGAFDDHRPRLTIAEVAANCDLTRAAARRYLKTPFVGK